MVGIGIKEPVTLTIDGVEYKLTAGKVLSVHQNQAQALLEQGAPIWIFPERSENET